MLIAVLNGPTVLICYWLELWYLMNREMSYVQSLGYEGC